MRLRVILSVLTAALTFLLFSAPGGCGRYNRQTLVETESELREYSSDPQDRFLGLTHNWNMSVFHEDAVVGFTKIHVHSIDSSLQTLRSHYAYVVLSDRLLSDWNEEYQNKIARFAPSNWPDLKNSVLATRISLDGWREQDIFVQTGPDAGFLYLTRVQRGASFYGMNAIEKTTNTKRTEVNP